MTTRKQRHYLKKNKTPRRIGITKEQMIWFIKVIQNNTDNLLLLQEKYMQEQQSLFHEKWKVRTLTRILKRVAPHEALSEEELDEQIKGREH